MTTINIGFPVRTAAKTDASKRLKMSLPSLTLNAVDDVKLQAPVGKKILARKPDVPNENNPGEPTSSLNVIKPFCSSPTIGQS
jgi:hypothetical protein